MKEGKRFPVELTFFKNAKQLFSRRRVDLLMMDTIMIAVVNLLMGMLSSFQIGSIAMNGFFSFRKACLLWGCLLISRVWLGVYNSIWRYANVKVYLKLMLADIIGGMVFFFIGRLDSSYSVGFGYSVVTLLVVILVTLASRFIYQYMYSYGGKSVKRSWNRHIFGDDGETDHNKINVAIVGAGNVGAILADELVRNPKTHYKPYCFIDIDAGKTGSEMNGIHIYPEDEYIVDKIKSLPVQEIVIALPDASKEDKGRLYDLYSKTGCKVKIYDYPLGNRRAGDSDKNKRVLREFRIEDLLFRDAKKVNSEKAKAYYKGKTILVTGGGGSIGSELCRQIAALGPKKLIILDIYENNAYDIQQELNRKYKGQLSLSTVIASVRDVKRLEEIFEQYHPQIVFHAAAHKHVPLMEHSGCEAIKNNVFGTYNVANTAEKFGVEKFLLISTDKAVNPTNVMGASKRLCEMVIQSRQDSKTEFTAVRFGNVLGSNGSVIPLFKRQIAAGGPITITDKRIIRYFMTIPEAVGLVMETCAMARNGELFVLDMGNPVKILDLAENMVRLSGLKPYEDIDITEIGLRPGEKLYEELLMKSEELDKTENEMIFIERDAGIDREEMERKLKLLSEAIDKHSPADSKHGHYEDVLQAIRDTVPTYHSPEELNKKAAQSDEMLRATGGDRDAEPIENEDDLEQELAETAATA